MKIIKPSVEITFPTADTKPMRHIEKCARLCYKSEDSIKEDSDRKLIANLYKRGHLAMMEHYRFIVEVCLGAYLELIGLHPNFLNFTDNCRLIVSGNVRAFYELYLNTHNVIVGNIIKQICDEKNLKSLFNNIEIEKNDFAPPTVKILNMDDLTEEELKVHGWYTVKFTCDRGVSHEIVRHRDASFAQESTRFCNYNKDKFGNEITFIEPCFWKHDCENYKIWLNACLTAEQEYMHLIEHNAKPEEARTVLPNSLKTEIYMTANINEHLLFDSLRCDVHAHPQMREVALMKLKQEYDKFPNIFGTLYDKYKDEIKK